MSTSSSYAFPACLHLPCRSTVGLFLRAVLGFTVVPKYCSQHSACLCGAVLEGGKEGRPPERLGQSWFGSADGTEGGSSASTTSTNGRSDEGLLRCGSP